MHFQSYFFNKNCFCLRIYSTCTLFLKLSDKLRRTFCHFIAYTTCRRRVQSISGCTIHSTELKSGLRLCDDFPLTLYLYTREVIFFEFIYFISQASRMNAQFLFSQCLLYFVLYSKHTTVFHRPILVQRLLTQSC
jgi:hypothetical protein